MNYAEGAVAVVAVLAWGAVFYGPWQETCVDWARQRIFEARDQLFDLALDGKLSFESSEYRTLRRALEGSIRFAHEFDWVRFVTFAIASAKGASRSSAVAAAIESISDAETRSEINRIFASSQNALFRMMVQRSLVLTALLPLGFLISIYIDRPRVKAKKLATEMVIRESERHQFEDLYPAFCEAA